MERRSFFKRIFKSADNKIEDNVPQKGGMRMRNAMVSSMPYIGEIQMVGFNFPPVGWAFCNGQILTIASNTALFSLLGTTYGGNGQTNFALPNLQGYFPMGNNQGPGLSPRTLGEQGGSETVTLQTNQIPPLSIQAPTVTVRGTGGTQGKGLTTGKQLGASTLSSNSSSALPVSNMPPYLAVNFIIALQGIFPPRP